MNRSTFAALTSAIAAVLATKPLLSESAPQTEPEQIAMLIYPNMTAMDLIGPQLIFSTLGNVKVHLVWKERNAVVSDTGVPITPTKTFDEIAGSPTVLFAPGGWGASDVMNDPHVVSFLQRVGPHAEYVTSVCTGALVLGASGLLRGYRATTHWTQREALATLGATPVAQRVVIDRNRITGAGVTAGLDFGLSMAAKMRGDNYARVLQLAYEYDPQPPFDAGSEAKAGEAIANTVKENFAPSIKAAQEAATLAARRFARD